MRNKPITLPDFNYELVLTEIPIQEKIISNRDKILISIKRNKEQQDTWKYYSIFERKLYTRSKESFLKSVFPKIN